jgi:hypothetical protein
MLQGRRGGSSRGKAVSRPSYFPEVDEESLAGGLDLPDCGALQQVCLSACCVCSRDASVWLASPSPSDGLLGQQRGRP